MKAFIQAVLIYTGAFIAALILSLLFVTGIVTKAHAGIKLSFSSSPIQDYVGEMQELKEAIRNGQADPESVYLFIDSRTLARHKAEFMDLVFKSDIRNYEFREPADLKRNIHALASEQLDKFNASVFDLIKYPEIRQVEDILEETADSDTTLERINRLDDELERVLDVIEEARKASQTAISDDEIRRMKEAADQAKSNAVADILENAISRNLVGASVQTSATVIR